MNPFLGLAVLSGAISLITGIQAGREAKRKATQSAYDIKLERENAKIQAMAQHNERYAEYETIMAQADNWLGLSNRGYDPSTMAGFKRSLKGLKKDTDKISYTSLMRDYRLRAKQQEVLSSGEYAQTAAITTGFNNAIQMAYQYQTTKFG
mgnify:FL=1